MFCSSLAVAAVAGMMATGSLAQQPDWQTDYANALKAAADQNKPLAVFIGQGGSGTTSAVTEGAIGTDAVDLLRSKFVCLYVDTATDAGRELADDFQMSRGIVVSDRTGTVQAYRRSGVPTTAELNGQLARIVSPPAAVTTTSYASPLTAAPAPSYAAPAPSYVAPRYYSAPAPTYQPTRAAPSFGGFGIIRGGGG